MPSTHHKCCCAPPCFGLGGAFVYTETDPTEHEHICGIDVSLCGPLCMFWVCEGEGEEERRFLRLFARADGTVHGHVNTEPYTGDHAGHCAGLSMTINHGGGSTTVSPGDGDFSFSVSEGDVITATTDGTDNPGPPDSTDNSELSVRGSHYCTLADGIPDGGCGCWVELSFRPPYGDGPLDQNASFDCRAQCFTVHVEAPAGCEWTIYAVPLWREDPDNPGEYILRPDPTYATFPDGASGVGSGTVRVCLTINKAVGSRRFMIWDSPDDPPVGFTGDETSGRNQVIISHTGGCCAFPVPDDFYVVSPAIPTLTGCVDCTRINMALDLYDGQIDGTTMTGTGRDAAGHELKDEIIVDPDDPDACSYLLNRYCKRDSDGAWVLVWQGRKEATLFVNGTYERVAGCAASPDTVEVA